MFIEVIGNQKNRIYVNNKASFYLERDNWNDFSFYTTYSLHLSGQHTTDGRPSLVGHLKILKFGQQEGDKYLLDLGGIDDLNEEFCSIGNSLDYYERIAALEKDLRDRILFALRDVIIYQDIKKEFEDEVGYHKSFMRDRKEQDDIFSLAPMIISRNYSHLPDLNQTFEFKTTGLEEPIVFDFSSPTFGLLGNISLPNRIAVLIGRNGSGKSTLLSRISRVAYASGTDREDDSLKQVGELIPIGMGFTRVILLSFSAFDAFQIPGIFKSDKELIFKEMKNGMGRFVFCGIRDILAELQDKLPSMKTHKDGRLSSSDILDDRTDNTKLKSVQDLGFEFCRNMNIIDETEQAIFFRKVIRTLSQEASLHSLLTFDFASATNEDLLVFFKDLSTGHKFVMHAVTSILAYTAPRSLLLFDEPETHLHPPILAVLMRVIRMILQKRDAFMILATHSPVILQETLMNNVYLVRREGRFMKISHPDIQTFGESIGTLTNEAFGLTAEITDFHHTLDILIEEITDDLTDSTPQDILEKIEAVFNNNLSIQARSYILSRIYSRQ